MFIPPSNIFTAIQVESSNSNARAAFRQNDPPSPVKQTSLGSATMAVAAPPDGTGTAQSAKFAYSFGGLASCASPPSSSTAAAANANQQQQNQFACGVMEHTRCICIIMGKYDILSTQIPLFFTGIFCPSWIGSLTAIRK
jgi:hypothetical protein